MAELKYMTPVNIPNYEDRIQNKSWEAESTLTTNGNGDFYPVPTGVKEVSFALDVESGGSGKVQVCFNKMADILASTDGSDLVWFDWDSGTLTADAYDATTSRVNAFRLVNETADKVVVLRATC